jgi:aldehyde dehydrogenase (NAD+)
MSVELQRLFERQRARRGAVSGTHAEERVAKLLRLKRAILDRRDAIAAALKADLGKSATESDLAEIHPTLEEINHAVDHLAEWMEPVAVPTPLLLAGSRSEIRHQPRGVVLILAPWNYPFYLTLTPLVGAIAAGNCVVVKPSEKAPATTRLLRELVAGTFEEEEIALVEGGAEVAERLLELPFDHFFFTGATAIGRKVMEAAARHLASVTLELGGKSPAIVDATANVAAAAEKIAWGRFLNAGQTCVSPDYVFVHETRASELIASVRETLAKFYGESAEQRARSPDLGRIVNERSFARLRGLLDRAVAAGARVEAGGTSDAATRYFEPTVLSGVATDSPVMEEEIFGPLLPVLTFRERSEVYRYLEGQAKPLALYVFSKKTSVVEEVLARTSSGSVGVNQVVLQLANPGLPFGGVGSSGQGNYHGFFGFRAFSHERAVLTQRRAGLIRFLFPPYAERMKVLAARLLRWTE